MDCVKERAPFIEVGYRALMHPVDAMKSMLYMHNETLNGWTMILGGCVALYLYLNSPMTPLYTLLFVSVVFHAPISFTYHALICTKNAPFWLNADVTSTFASSTILVYILSTIAFPDNLFIRNVFVIAAFAVFTWFVLNTWIKPPPTNLLESPKTTLTFQMGIIVSLYLLPILYIGVRHTCSKCAFYAWIVIVSIISGGLLYVLEFPECVVTKYTSAISYIGNSHHIMHLLLIVAHVAEFRLLQISDTEF